MDYLHYRLKGWKPFEYLNLKEGQKRVAAAYMHIEMEERTKHTEDLEE